MTPHNFKKGTWIEEFRVMLGRMKANSQVIGKDLSALKTQWPAGLSV